VIEKRPLKQVVKIKTQNLWIFRAFWAKLNR